MASLNTEIPVIAYEDLVDLVKNPKPNTILIDVREPSEYEQGNIPTTHLLPLGQVNEALTLSGKAFEEKYGFSKPTPDTNMVFHCLAGIRSLKAAEIAKAAGYDHVVNYFGGWADWEARTKN